jgi:hypothetical protein
MFHCHNLVHEDHDMMRAYVAVGGAGQDNLPVLNPATTLLINEAAGATAENVMYQESWLQPYCAYSDRFVTFGCYTPKALLAGRAGWKKGSPIRQYVVDCAIDIWLPTYCQAWLLSYAYPACL